MSDGQRVYTMRAITTFVLLSLIACQDSADQTAGGQLDQGNLVSAPASAEQRWFSQAQVSRGQEVFTQNCAVCHGDEAQGLAEDWRQRLPGGSFPPPPLNGSAHAWHHPLFQLMQTIETGGVPYGGQMPPFAEVLDDDEKLAAIAYFQSFWDEEIYLSWLDRGGLD
jgi:mono/diheme cytochrome c family protein